MIILPDCAVCGEAVVVDIDIDGAVESCTGCGLSQRYQVLRDREQWHHMRQQVRRAIRARMAQHKRCRDDKCDCLCHRPTRAAA